MVFVPEIRFIAVFIQVFILVNAEKPVVHFPVAYPLDIDKMFYRNILGSDVFPSGPAAKRKRRRKHGVCPADGSLRRRCIYHDAPCIDQLAEFHYPLFVIGINTGAMAYPSKVIKVNA